MLPVFTWQAANLAKIAAHGVTVEEVDEVFAGELTEEGVSWSSGRPIVKGYTAAGRYLVIVYEEQDDDPRRLYVVTAFGPGE